MLSLGRRSRPRTIRSARSTPMSGSCRCPTRACSSSPTSCTPRRSCPRPSSSSISPGSWPEPRRVRGWGISSCRTFAMSMPLHTSCDASRARTSCTSPARSTRLRISRPSIPSSRCRISPPSSERSSGRRRPGRAGIRMRFAGARYSSGSRGSWMPSSPCAR